MTGMWVDVEVENLSSDELAAALDGAGSESPWGCRAAVGLIVDQGTWLRRDEFRQAVEAEVDEAGRMLAWVNWSEIDTDAPASAGEIRILEIARSLAGIPTSRPLADLLSGLDDTNLARVLRAFRVSARGRAS